MKNKKILALWLALLTLGLGITSVSGTAILHPGYIDGSVSVTDLTGIEALEGGEMDAFSLSDDFDAHTGIETDGTYHLTVEGNYEYRVFAEAWIRGECPEYWYLTEVAIGSQDTFVEVDQTVSGLDFQLDPGRIWPIVTTMGAEIERMNFLVATDFELAEQETFAAYHNIYPKPGFVLNGDESTFPMRPWASLDLNGDGNYNDDGDTFVKVSGYIWVDGVRYYLAPEYVDVVASQTTVVEWNLDLSANMYGNVAFQGETVSYYNLRGRAEVDGVTKSIDLWPDPTIGHNLNLPPAEWNVYAYAYFNYGTAGTKIVATPRIIDTIASGESKEFGWYIVPAYVSGTIWLNGAHGNFVGKQFYGSSSSIDNSPGDTYRLLLREGTWRIGYRYQFLYFDYDDHGFKSTLELHNEGAPYITLEPGDEITGVDFSYDTATITVQYRVDLPGGEHGWLHTPKLRATSSTGTEADQIVSIATGEGTHELTQLGECTITVLPGTHYIAAYATVDGSYTKFDEFSVTVEAGDEVTLDIEAPEVYVSQPGGSEHTCDSSVEVIGTATDISGVASVTVNGYEAEFSLTGNPEDPHEVSFSYVVDGLVRDEWNTITIVVTDTEDNSITVERQVFRDICNLPPEITYLSGPLDPVAVGASVDMFATFTDPDIDDMHTALWQWGDGSTTAGMVDQTARTVTGSHYYETPGVYTVTLTVTDCSGESDTEVWSQYTVIYDPSAGFVTGGGWIESPPGACPSDPTLTGTANFGFVAKYKKGADVPTGTTEFQFSVGNLNFHSDSYEWLLIAGAKAMFKGTGTINGEGCYKFMVTAIDGALASDGTPDSFRIKIWTEDEATGEETVYYDNGGTVLSGGSITIHAKG